MSIGQTKSKCAVLYSGGTDSTCVAAMAAKKYGEVHLITYFERSTKRSPIPSKNIERLRAAYPEVKFHHHVINVDAWVKWLSYERYFKNIKRFGFLVLATPGYSSLSWHMQTIIFCMDREITSVFDGLTRELMHFPGHMDAVVEEFRKLYEHFGLDYANLVRDLDVPVDQNLLDRFIVDRHGFVLRSELNLPSKTKTTGKYLYDEGIFPNPNVKGSKFDQEMQHDCYPFVLYNMLAYWIYLNLFSPQQFCEKILALMRSKIEVAKIVLEHYRRPSPAGAALGDLMGDT